MPGDSCVHQKILITHEIRTLIDANYSLEVKSVFWIHLKHFIDHGTKNLKNETHKFNPRLLG